MEDIVVYGTANNHCSEHVSYLEDKGYTVKFVDVIIDHSAYEMLESMGFTTVPVTKAVRSDRYISGTSKQAIDKFLEYV